MKRALLILVALGLVGWLSWSLFTGWGGGYGKAGKSGGSGGTGDPGAQQTRQTDQGDARPITGIVFGPDEKPLVGARLRVHRIVSHWPRPKLHTLETLTTGAGGHFAFRTQRGPDLMIEANAAGCGRLLEPAPEQSQTLKLRLSYGFRIRGRVLLPNNQPAAACEILMEPSAWSQMRAVRQETDTSGRFEFTGVPAEVVRVTARHPDFSPISIASVTGGVSGDLTLQFAEEDGLVLSGTVSKVGDTGTEREGGRGAPVVGAEVSVYPSVLNRGLYQPQRASTNKAGHYEVTGLGRGNFFVEIRHPDHSTVVRRLALRQSKTAFDFDLMGRANVRGRFLNGDRLAGSLLQLISMYGETARTRVELDGSFRFPVTSFTLGPATLELEQGPLCFKKSNSRRLNFRIDEEGEVALELELTDASAMRGRVTDQRGSAVPDVLVSTFLQSRASVPTSKVLAVTDREGRYEILGLPAGQISLRFQHDDYAFHEQQATVEAGSRVNIPTIRLTAPATIRGRVIRRGKGVSGAAVFVGRGFKRISQQITAADGSYVLRGLPPGSHSVKARYSTLPLVSSKDDIAVSAGQTVKGIDLVFNPGRSITGVVTDQDDDPMVGVEVIGPQNSRTRTDSAGRFELEVPIGQCRLRFRSQQDVELGTQVVRADVDRVEARVNRMPLATLTGRVYGMPGRRPLSGAIAELKMLKQDTEVQLMMTSLRGGRWPLSLRPRTEGVRWLEMPGGRLNTDVPAGIYYLTLHCRGYEPYVHPKAIELMLRKNVDLGDIELQPGAKLRGRVVGPNGKPIPEARVLLGKESFLYLRRARNDYLTDGEGLFEIAGVGPDQRRLVVAAPGYAPRSVSIVVPDDLLRTKPRVIRLELGGVVEVKVVDEFGEPQAFRLVLLSMGLTEVRRDRTDEHGIVRFKHLQGGLYRAQLRGDLRSTKGVPVRDTSGKTVYKVRMKPGRRRSRQSRRR